MSQNELSPRQETKNDETKDVVLRVENLVKTFRLSDKQRKMQKTREKEKRAVDGLSFCVKRGEIYGLLGPNGAGKTTTLRMISTLIKPNSGDAFVDGYGIVREAEKVRGKIGFLTGELKPDDFFTPSYLFDFYSELHGVDDATKAARKNALFSRFGIDRFSETKIAELSTGMKQKVSIAISLAHDPDLIVFDEPTNGLDVLTAKTVTDFLVEQKNRGKTVLLSTHIFSLVEKICDRVGIIVDGKMACEDDVARLTREKDLETVFFDLYKSLKGED